MLFNNQLPRTEPTCITTPMNPELLPAVAAFARVAALSSFTRAATEIGVSTSALSHTVRTLEVKLGIRLLNRTTRKVSLTEMGQQFLEDISPALAKLHAAAERLEEQRHMPSGVLRISLPRIAFDSLLAPHVPAFLAAYPLISLDLQIDNRYVDLLGEGFDMGIRLNERLARNMVAVALGPMQRLVVFAAPSYVREHGAPQQPADLQGHNCLNFRASTGDAVYQWEFSSPNMPGHGTDLHVPTAGRVISNDMQVLIHMAKAGVGVCAALGSEVQADVDAGHLVPVLTDWQPHFPGFYIYYPSRAQMARKQRVFIDFMTDRLRPSIAR